MRTGVIQHPSGVRPPKSLVARGGLVRTFGGLAGFLVVTFFCWGLYMLEEAFADPRGAGAAAVISAAFILTLAAMLLFFLIRPGKRARTMSHGGSVGATTAVVRPDFKTAAGAARHHHLRNDLAYQRFYVDHSRIRP